MKKTNAYNWKIFSLLLIPLAIFMRKLISLSPEFCEQYYSRGLYKLILQPISLITGIFPFSIAEIFIILIALYLPIRIGLLLVKALQKKDWKLFLPFIYNIILVGSLWFFLQSMLWNLNYERMPFSESAGIEVTDSSADDLYDMCKAFIERTNQLRSQVSEDNNGVMTVKSGYKSILNRSKLGYDILERQYPFLKGNYGRPKPVILSRLMSHSNIIGIYSTLTGEANIDIDIPCFDIPSTTMHEIAHQRGVAREDEANYIAYAACMAHPDVEFKYSGSAMALQYSMNALYTEDAEKYYELIKSYSEAYRRDIDYDRAYWSQFQGKTKEIANILNDSYLKLNGQSDGVKSYGRMVDLLLAEYKGNLTQEEQN